jgi:hypothetical protein
MLRALWGWLVHRHRWRDLADDGLSRTCLDGRCKRIEELRDGRWVQVKGPWPQVVQRLIREGIRREVQQLRAEYESRDAPQ